MTTKRKRNRNVQRLSETAIKNAKPAQKPRKLIDGGGLYVLLNPNGSRLWRFKYRFNGREQLLALGKHPAVSLTKARAACADARKLLADGINPSEARKVEKAALANTFEGVAREWHSKHAPKDDATDAENAEKWSKSYADKTLRRLELHVFPLIGSRPIGEIKARDLLPVLTRIADGSANGAHGTVKEAHKLRQICSSVFCYAIPSGRADHDPAQTLRGKTSGLPPVRAVKHYAAITEPKRVGELLRAIDGYCGTFAVKCALKLAPLLFTRPGELRRAEWSEFTLDVDEPEWRIPAGKMKAGVEHRVPLAPQALAILRELKPFTGSGRYLFPGARDPKKPMSDNTLRAALHTLGFTRDDMTPHGFRGMASTLLNEAQWHREAIERQLAHGERNKTLASYNHAAHIPERRKMMKFWADYLDTLRAGGAAKVIPLAHVKQASAAA